MDAGLLLEEEDSNTGMKWNFRDIDMRNSSTDLFVRDFVLRKSRRASVLETSYLIGEKRIDILVERNLC